MIIDGDDCPTCDGRGWLEVDGADSRGEHVTRTMACDCVDGGADCAEDCESGLEVEGVDYGREVAWEPRELGGES